MTREEREIRMQQIDSRVRSLEQANDRCMERSGRASDAIMQKINELMDKRQALFAETMAVHNPDVENVEEEEVLEMKDSNCEKRNRIKEVLAKIRNNVAELEELLEDTSEDDEEPNVVEEWQKRAVEINESVLQRFGL